MKIRLLTRCGCERIIEVSAPAREHIVPLARPQAGTVDDYLRIELDEDGMPVRQPVNFENRRFLRQPRTALDDIPTYLEQP